MAYTDADKFGIVPRGKDTNVNQTINGNNATIYSSLNISQLLQNLISNLNRPQPRSWIGQWWRRMNLKDEPERIELLAAMVEKVHVLSEKVTNLNVEAYLTQERLSILVHYDRQRAIKEGELILRELDIKMQEAELEFKRKQQEIDLLYERSKEEIRTIRIENDRRDTINRVVRNISDALDYSSLSPVYKFFIILQLIAGGKGGFNPFDFEMHEAKKRFFERELEASVSQQEAKARTMGAAAEQKEYQTKMEKADLEEELKKLLRKTASNHPEVEELVKGLFRK